MNNNEKEESTEGLKARLLKNLKETGYPAELKVGDILSKYGWQVEHNRYYLDEDEQKGREVDIAAHQFLNPSKHKLRVGLALICEVKRSLRNPWIILSTAKGILGGGEGWGRLCYTIGQVDNKLLSFEEIERVSTTSQFTRFGRSYYEGFKSTNAKSEIFEALTTTVKASEHWLKSQGEAIKNFQTKGPYEQDFRELTFVDSLVILDGLLYEAYIDKGNHLKLNEIEHIPVSFGYISTVYKRYNYLVEIVTLNELPSLLLKKQKWIANLKNTIINKLGSS